MKRANLYTSLYNGYVKAYSTRSKLECQKEVNEIWKRIKSDANVFEKVESLLKEYDAFAKKKKGTLLTFWAKQALKQDTLSQISTVPDVPTASSHVEEHACGSAESNPSKSRAEDVGKYKTKVQDELKVEIDLIKSDMVGLYKRKESGLITKDQEKELLEKKRKVEYLEKELTKKKREQERQQKTRLRKKETLARICAENPEVSNALKIREKTGRPAIEIDQPMFLKAIIDIALHGSAAHEKRKSDIYRSIRTLDELTEQLNTDGFHFSRSTVYTRLLPRRSSTLEGKRHVSTVPVKLIRSQNYSHSKHIDGTFCTATLRHLEELSSVLGHNEVCFISQDDKARVPIGLTAANKQAPLLMHVEYRVSLPDHDWIVAAKHKLIPSVYAGICIEKDGLGKPEAVSYSGPTYIAIRSGKHSSSSAFAHGLDFDRLLDLDEFDTIIRDERDKLIKPIVVFAVDGGPDENPRYQKVIEVAIHHFVKNNLDALFIAANAPGRSAFNRVERRMAPLSRELSGVILPHEHYGSHLDSQGRTINEDLEKINFKFAGETLAEIWSNVVIDQFATVAEYINPDKSELDAAGLISKDQEWFDNHVRTSQYFTQIVKCQDIKCCDKVRSSYFSVLPSRFFPLPIPINQTTDGLKAPEIADAGSHKFPSLFLAQTLKFNDIMPRSTGVFKVKPYDLYCPSLQTSLLDRICKVCHLYFASQTMLKKHAEQHRARARENVPKQNAPESTQPKRIRPLRIAARRQRELMAVIARRENANSEDIEWLDEDEVDLSTIVLPGNYDGETSMPVVTMDEHFTSPWMDDAL